ncbi:MAG TPA: sigma-70 family RNA polymerase sigma factor [Candidatus Saccharimonadales bacterium]|nr:sigma-70 family RNA polymerase sigma factor [Candidatus Saccharimonadales bacterium]
MYFPTTQWSLLARASLDIEGSARQALEELCRRYWSPVHQFIRGRGYGESDAQDLTQEFVVHLLEHSTFARADRTRGRFRSFLLGALTRFLADEYDRRRAQKRGEGAVHLPLDDEIVERGLPADFAGAGAESFDREWALVVLENALRVLQQQQEVEAASRRFAVLRQFLPGSLATPSYDEAARQLGMNVPAFKSELHRIRQQFRTLVRQEIAATVCAPHEIEEEMHYLQSVLMDRGSDLGSVVKPSPGNS